MAFTIRALSRTLWVTTMLRAAKTAMIVIVTNNSTKVKPVVRDRRGCVSLAGWRDGVMERKSGFWY